MSEGAKTLLDLLLTKEPSVRPDIKDMLGSPWVMRELPAKFQTALAANAEEQLALSAAYLMPPENMSAEVSELVRKACVHGLCSDRPFERVDLRPIKQPSGITDEDDTYSDVSV